MGTSKGFKQALWHPWTPRSGSQMDQRCVSVEGRLICFLPFFPLKRYLTPTRMEKDQQHKKAPCPPPAQQKQATQKNPPKDKEKEKEKEGDKEEKQGSDKPSNS